MSLDGGLEDVEESLVALASFSFEFFDLAQQIFNRVTLRRKLQSLLCKLPF